MILLVAFVVGCPVMVLLTSVFKVVFYVAMIDKQLDGLKCSLDKIFTSGVTEDSKDLYLESNASFHKIDYSKRVQECRKIYNLIYDNSELINASHGLMILFYLAIMVLMLILRLYEMFTIYVGDLPSHHIFGSGYSVALAGVVIVTTIVYCQQAQNTVSNYCFQSRLRSKLSIYSWKILIRPSAGFKRTFIKNNLSRSESFSRTSIVK